MADGGPITYEIQTYDGGRWVLNETLPDEEAARRKAADLLGLKHIAGARIIKAARFGSGTTRETEIFKRIKEAGKSEDFTIATVDSAPLCEKLADYYKTAARNTMARLFIKYLEKFELTPLEVLHHHASLKRLVNLDSLVPSAVDRVAGLQSRAAREDSRKRRDTIFKAVDALVKRARDADDKPIPDLSKSTLDEVLARIDTQTKDEDERQFMANVALAKVSVNWRSLLAKISSLLPMAQSQHDARALVMIDEMMADILVARTIVRDTIGISKHMGDAIMRILDLIEGKCTPTKYAAVDALNLLNVLFAKNKLPRSKAVLFERIEHDLKSAVPLTGSEQVDVDKELFAAIVQRVVTGRGMIGGHAVAGGLADRWARLNNVGGPLGRRKAIEGVCALLKTNVLRLIYLLALYDEKVDADFRGALEAQINAIVRHLDSIKKIAPSAPTEKARLQDVAAIQKLVLDSRLEGRLKDPISGMFDGLVSDYLVAENVIQRLDDSRLPFRERATGLVTFCASGVLTVGRANAIAREAIVHYLRRKDFISEFTADIPSPADKEKAIKEFYGLLAGTGFDVHA